MATPRWKAYRIGCFTLQIIRRKHCDHCAAFRAQADIAIASAMFALSGILSAVLILVVKG